MKGVGGTGDVWAPCPPHRLSSETLALPTQRQELGRGAGAAGAWWQLRGDPCCRAGSRPGCQQTGGGDAILGKGAFKVLLGSGTFALSQGQGPSQPREAQGTPPSAWDPLDPRGLRPSPGGQLQRCYRGDRSRVTLSTGRPPCHRDTSTRVLAPQAGGAVFSECMGVKRVLWHLPGSGRR